jgi:hypothetical protein
MRNIYNSLVYHYEIYIPGYTEPLDSKICFSSALRALAKGRSLKKEHARRKSASTTPTPSKPTGFKPSDTDAGRPSNEVCQSDLSG